MAHISQMGNMESPLTKKWSLIEDHFLDILSKIYFYAIPCPYQLLDVRVKSSRFSCIFCTPTRAAIETAATIVF